jgi:hypothetical protein
MIMLRVCSKSSLVLEGVVEKAPHVAAFPWMLGHLKQSTTKKKWQMLKTTLLEKRWLKSSKRLTSLSFKSQFFYSGR